MTTLPAVPSIVAGHEALADFRRGLTGERALAWLEEANGRLLITLPVGAGKTEFMIKILLHANSVATQFDLVVVLVPRRDILEEILRKLPPGHPSIVLEPRPRRQCGGLDARWVEHEKAGCGLLARETLCGACPRRTGCGWPGQYRRDRLGGAPLVLATQHHLVLNPGFIDQLRELTGARRPLVLLDESDLLVKGDRREIPRADLQRYLHTLKDVHAKVEDPPGELRELQNLVSARPSSRAAFPQASSALRIQRRRTKPLRGGPISPSPMGIEWPHPMPRQPLRRVLGVREDPLARAG